LAHSPTHRDAYPPTLSLLHTLARARALTRQVSPTHVINFVVVNDPQVGHLGVGGDVLEEVDALPLRVLRALGRHFEQINRGQAGGGGRK